MNNATLRNSLLWVLSIGLTMGTVACGTKTNTPASSTATTPAPATPAPTTPPTTPAPNGVPLALTPSQTSVVAGGTMSLTSNVAATWAVTSGGGSVTNTATASTSATYTAPSTPGTATITATEAADKTISATNTVTIQAPTVALTVSPGTANTVEGHTQQFTANASVSWSTSCGTINSAGLFTAPNALANCTITAGETGTERTGTAIDNVTAPANQGLNYVTWKNDNGRTGQQRNETALTPNNVNSATFGVLFSVSVVGRVFAQPLYMTGVTIGGSKHNAVFVATEHNSVYAFDADTYGAPLWTTSFLINGASTVPQANVSSTIYPEIGITGTPVIDAGSGTLYLVASTLEAGNYVLRLHALDVTTGNEQFGSPRVITAPGFAPKEQLQRPGLVIANGNVYIAFGSHGDTPPYSGWVMAYSEATLAQVAAWNVTLGGTAGAIWGAGGGLVADSNGDIYVTTGNGSWNGSTQFSNSWVRLSPGLKVLDWFTPFNEALLTNQDVDLGSGGVLLVPDQPGAVPHEMIGCGKFPTIYVANRDDMGHQNPGSDSQIIQSITSGQVGSAALGAIDRCFMTPAYWEQNLYFVGNNDVIKQFTLNPTTGMMSTSPASRGTFTFTFPGAQPVTSSNGATDGIVWAVSGASQLHAFAATNVSNSLYTSAPLSFEKWAVPTVVDGKVYVAGQGKLYVFGLF